MSLQCEIMELEAVAGREFNLDAFGQLTDRLGRCFQRLGLKRTARSVRDVTLDAVASDLKRKRNGGQDVSTA
jgi:hypothetical protein